MISKVYAIWDDAAKAFLQPFLMLQDAQAVRAFEASVNDRRTQFAQTPADFTLFRLGTFDDGPGRFEQAQAPELVVSALQLVRRSESGAQTSWVEEG